jgi:hypothetical protein
MLEGDPRQQSEAPRADKAPSQVDIDAYFSKNKSPTIVFQTQEQRDAENARTNWARAQKQSQF